IVGLERALDEDDLRLTCSDGRLQMTRNGRRMMTHRKPIQIIGKNGIDLSADCPRFQRSADLVTAHSLKPLCIQLSKIFSSRTRFKLPQPCLRCSFKGTE